MRQVAPAIEQPIPKSLVHRHLAVLRIQMQRPGRFARGLRRIIQAQGNAELALLPINVLVQLRSALLGGEVYVGRLDGLTHDVRNRNSQLMVEETGDPVIVRAIATRPGFIS